MNTMLVKFVQQVLEDAVMIHLGFNRDPSEIARYIDGHRVGIRFQTPCYMHDIWTDNLDYPDDLQNIFWNIIPMRDDCKAALERSTIIKDAGFYKFPADASVFHTDGDTVSYDLEQTNFASVSVIAEAVAKFLRYQIVTVTACDDANLIGRKVYVRKKREGIVFFDAETRKRLVTLDGQLNYVVEDDQLVVSTKDCVYVCEA